MSRLYCHTACLLLTLILATAGGCAGRVNVTGKVLDKGKPVPGAMLRWVSEDGSVFGSGASDGGGSYVVETGGKRGAAPGRYQVTVSWWRTRDGKPLPEGEAGAAMKGTARAREFTATLAVTVEGGATTLDLDVTGKGKPVEPDGGVP